MLQNSSTLKEFNILLENIFNFFNQTRQNDTFLKSKYFIERSIQNRKLMFDIDFATSKEDKKRSEFFSSNEIAENKKEKRKAKKSYMIDSPWTSYFNKIITKFQNVYRIDSSSHDRLILPNIFFRPDMFKLITKQLYLTPVWSGILIAFHFDSNKGKKKFLTRYWLSKIMKIIELK